MRSEVEAEVPYPGPHTQSMKHKLKRARRTNQFLDGLAQTLAGQATRCISVENLCCNPHQQENRIFWANIDIINAINIKRRWVNAE